MNNLAIGGEIISATDAMKLVDYLYAHASELAGQFYEKNRSPKFRVNWPNAYDFAEANKKAFVAQARADFTTMLGREKTPEATKKRLYLALLVERAFAAGLEQLGKEADNQLQIHTGTQQFEGDKAENRKIMETYGPTPNLRAKLKAGAAKFVRMH